MRTFINPYLNMIFNKYSIVLFVFAVLTMSSIGTCQAQVLEAAYCEWEDLFDEWKIHVNADEFVFANRQRGLNQLRRWSLTYEDSEGNERSGFMQLKWENNLNYWDFFFDNERLSIEKVYRDDIFTWKILHDDNVFTITAKNRFGFEWEDRFARNFDWEMYQVDIGNLHHIGPDKQNRHSRNLDQINQ